MTHTHHADMGRCAQCEDQTPPTVATVSLDVPAALWLTANGREHWREKARRTALLRSLARHHAGQRTTRHAGPVNVTATICYPTARRADPANASPTVKAILDGIVDAGLLGDDDHHHVPRVSFERGPDTKTRGLYVVRIDLEPSA